MGDEPTPHARIYLTPPCCGNYEHGEVTWCEDAANECGNCGTQPTEYLHSALAPIRAAEILAAEANERARIVASLRATSTGLDLTNRRIADAIERGEHLT